MSTIQMVDPLTVAPGEKIRPIPSRPASDGVVSWIDVDAHGDEEFHLVDGRTVWHRYGIPIAVVRPDESAEPRRGEQVEVTIRGTIAYATSGQLMLRVNGGGSVWISREAMADGAVTVTRRPAGGEPR